MVIHVEYFDLSLHPFIKLKEELLSLEDHFIILFFLNFHLTWTTKLFWIKIWQQHAPLCVLNCLVWFSWSDLQFLLSQGERQHKVAPGKLGIHKGWDATTRRIRTARNLRNQTRGADTGSRRSQSAGHGKAKRRSQSARNRKATRGARRKGSSTAYCSQDSEGRWQPREALVREWGMCLLQKDKCFLQGVDRHCVDRVSDALRPLVTARSAAASSTELRVRHSLVARRIPTSILNPISKLQMLKCSSFRNLKNLKQSRLNENPHWQSQ